MSQTGPQVSETYPTVMALQRKLNSLGANLKVDGIIGPKTQAAMTKYGLDVWGNPAKQTAPAGATGATGGLPTGTPPSGSDADVRSQYGAWAWALDIPQFGDILRQAASAGWPPAQVQAAIEQTAWWRQSSDANRKWQEETQDNPTQAQADITQKRADIIQIATQLGIPISDDRLTQMATGALQFGLDPTQLQQMIGSEFHYKPGGQAGSVGQAEVSLKSMAGQYFVSLGDQTLAQWEGQIAQGMSTADDFRNRIIDLAKGTYKAPWIQQDLDKGQTMDQIADPYRQLASQLLEVPADSIDFTNPKWQVALTQQDPKTGDPVGMDIATWGRTLRSDPTYGWDHTQNARDAKDAFAQKFLQAIGRSS